MSASSCPQPPSGGHEDPSAIRAVVTRCVAACIGEATFAQWLGAPAANDVVNPAARTRKSSPIYGMPILNVDQARQAYVVKRGQGKGYSGVENELFFLDNTSMVYGDAQKVMVQMIEAVKSLG